MLASAARADVGVQCWENEFNCAACTPMLPGSAVLKDSHLRCAHSQVELLPAQTDPIMDCGLSSSIDYLFSRGEEN